MFFLYFLIWIILNGRVTAEIVLFGIAIASAGTLLAYKVLGLNGKKEMKIWGNACLLAQFLLVLVWEIIKASVSVMKVALSPSDKPDPIVKEFDSGFQTDFQNVLLANAITLTPGTFTLFQEGDHFVVHCLKAEYADGIEFSTFIRLLRKMKV